MNVFFSIYSWICSLSLTVAIVFDWVIMVRSKRDERWSLVVDRVNSLMKIYLLVILVGLAFWLGVLADSVGFGNQWFGIFAVAGTTTTVSNIWLFTVLESIFGVYAWLDMGATAYYYHRY